MTVVELDDGWAVLDEGGKHLVAGLPSNSAAWRWIDRREGDAVSANEKRHEYGWSKYTES
jgi:hypothetical protein